MLTANRANTVMNTETNQDGSATENGAGEGETTQVETIQIPKSDYEKLNQTVGSLKRELKDLKKPKEEAPQTPQTNPDEFGLLQKTFLRAAGVTSEAEMELAQKLQKETGMGWDKLVDSKYFKTELEELRTTQANAVATSNVRGNAATTQAKLSVDHWLQQGRPPTPADVPDAKTRQKIITQMMKSGSGKVFYND